MMTKTVYEDVRAIRISTDSIDDIEELIKEYKDKGYTISNPDCKSGEYFDVITRGNLKVIGFDLMWGKNGGKYYE